MKKSIIALAVAGAMTVPMIAQADATLFGEIRWDLDKVENTKAKSDITRMRVGVMGSEEMDNGMTAGYFIRLDAGTNAAGTGSGKSDGNISAHKTTLYVSGGFGKLVFGDSGSAQEISEDRIAYSTFSEELDILGDGKDTGGGVRYESNTMSGVKVILSVGNINNSDVTGISNVGGAISYDNDAFGVTISAGQDSVAGAETAIGISADTTVAGITLGANFAKIDSLKSNGFAAKYSVTDSTSLAMNYQTQKNTNVDKKSYVTVSANHSLGGGASLNAAYIAKNDAAGDDQIKLRYKVTF